MGKVLLKLAVLMTAWGGVFPVGPSLCAAEPPASVIPPRQSTINNKPSITESISSSVTRGLDKLGKVFSPQVPVTPAPDAVMLSTKAAPTAKLYMSMARLYEQSGQLAEAEKQYRKALKQSPNHLGALLGYARLKDRLKQADEAKKLYQRAVQAYPNEASVFNNLGAFHGRRGRLNESVAALKRAVELQPKQAKYRNNLAVVLVELGRPREAFEHLRAVSSDAVAYYNLGFLLSKKGQTQAAVRHFAIALQIDPSMHQARQMLQQLAVVQRPQVRPPAVRQLPPPPKRSPQDGGQVSSGARPQPPDAAGPMLPGPPATRRLPVTRRLPPTSGPPGSRPEAAPLPRGSFRRAPTPEAPLPPASERGPLIRPLPGVD